MSDERDPTIGDSVQPIHHEVLIVGGGFGGYYAAHELTRHGIPVAIIDTTGRQTFQPLLYQAATGLLEPDDLEFPLSSMADVTSIADRVTAVDLTAMTVTTQQGVTLTTDHLVLATGAQVNFFGVTGAAEHALPLYTDENARAIKQRLQELAFQDEGPIRAVIVGAGATGVEITGALVDVFSEVLPRTFPKFTGRQVALHLVDHSDEPLAAMSQRSRRFAEQTLTDAGVSFHLGRSVTQVDPGSVRLDDGTELASDLTIWAGGLTVGGPTITPQPQRGHGGRMVVSDDLRLPNQEAVYCIGDAAADAIKPLPQLGSVAKQQGTHVGHSIRRQRKGKPPEPFHYRDMGDMAMVRHDRAVVEMGEHHHEVTGTPAYAMWLGLHAYLLPGERNRIQTLQDWAHELSTGTSRFLTD